MGRELKVTAILRKGSATLEDVRAVLIRAFCQPALVPRGRFGRHDDVASGLRMRGVRQRDLSDLGAGHHVVALDGSDLGTGVYWARVRQGASEATARVVWTR